MAEVKGTALVSQIIGKLGEVDFFRCRNRMYARMSPISVLNPQTEKQTAQRNALGYSSHGWRKFLTVEQRATWESYACQLGRQEAIPSGWRTLTPTHKGKMFGKDAFVYVTTQLASAGLPAVNDAPLGKKPPGLPLIYTISFDGVTLFVNWHLFSFDSGAKIRIWIRSQQQLFHKQILISELAYVGAASVSSVIGALGEALYFKDLIGSAVFLQIDCVNSNGTTSRGSETELKQVTTVFPAFELRRPSGDDIFDWLAYPAAPATHFDKVNGILPNFDSAYIFSSGVGTADVFLLPASSIPVGAVIDYVKISGWVKGESTPELAFMFFDGSTYHVLPAIPLPSSWELRSSSELEVNPVTVEPWTLEELAALRIGVQCSAGTVYCSQLYVEVAYRSSEAVSEYLARLKSVLEWAQAAEAAGYGSEWLADYQEGCQDAAAEGDRISVAAWEKTISEFIIWLLVEIAANS